MRLAGAIRSLPQSEYCRTIASAKLALCVLSRRNRNEFTGRSFEIPAIGGCLLAADTAEHRYFYRNGQEAIFFRSSDELVIRCREWLKRPEARWAIAEAGRKRCLSLGLSWKDHMRREWELVSRNLVHNLTPFDDSPFWTGFRQGDVYQNS